MSFKKVQAKIAREKGISEERAGAILAATTRKTMARHGMSTKHGIPKGVYDVMKRTHSPDCIGPESKVV